MSSSFQWSAITYTFKWTAVGDHRTCSKCLSLNGQEIEGTPFSSTLNHPIYGPIWDFVADQPLTHGHTPINCRCMIMPMATVHYSEIEELSPLDLESVQVNFPMGTSIDQLKEQISGLSASLEETTSALRQMRMLMSSLGLPGDLSQGLMMLQRLRYALTSTVPGIGALGLEFLTLYGLREGLPPLLQALGVKNWEDFQRQQQHEVEKFKLSLRGTHY